MKYPFPDFIRRIRRAHGVKLISHISFAERWYQSVVPEVVRIPRFLNTYLSRLYVIYFPRLRFGQNPNCAFIQVLIIVSFCHPHRATFGDVGDFHHLIFHRPPNLSPSRINPLHLLSKNNLAFNPSNILDRFYHFYHFYHSY